MPRRHVRRGVRPDRIAPSAPRRRGIGRIHDFADMSSPPPSTLLELHGFLVDQSSQPQLLSLVVDGIVLEGEQHARVGHDLHFRLADRLQELRFQRLLHRNPLIRVYLSLSALSLTKHEHSFQQP